MATAIGTCSFLFLFAAISRVFISLLNLFTSTIFGYMTGLGTEYFRSLLQSNCGVSVLDFTPRADGGSPHVCLNRLNQVKCGRQANFFFTSFIKHISDFYIAS